MLNTLPLNTEIFAGTEIKDFAQYVYHSDCHFYPLLINDILMQKELSSNSRLVCFCLDVLSRCIRAFGPSFELNIAINRLFDVSGDGIIKAL